MSALLTPNCVDEVVEAVRSLPRVLAVGNQTKPRLSMADSTRLCLPKLHGIVEYEPSEFTVTVLAGTPVRDLIQDLAQRGQYLPFDPFLVQAVATVGGTVAAGLSGPGRFRFGGVRDFILGARFIDGTGRLLRLGGKVVKNAAGFDLPKFFVGSLGRFGVLVELTFKVFPAPVASVTCKLNFTSLAEAQSLLTKVGSSRFEADALDIPPGGDCILVRLAGPAPGLDVMAKDLFACWSGERLASEDAELVWAGLREFAWAYPAGPLVKVPITAATLPGIWQISGSIPDLRVHVSAGGNLAFLSLPDEERAGDLANGLRQLCLSGLTLRGAATLWWGEPPNSEIAHAVKSALDPQGRFPGLDE